MQAKHERQVLCSSFMREMNENDLSFKVIGRAIELHKRLGPGLLEKVYEDALAYDLIEAGIFVRQQVGIPMRYKQLEFDRGFRLDLLVGEKLIVEVKSVEMLAPVHYAQLLTYLKLSDKKLGLLINFNSAVLREDIHRVVNGL